MKNLLLLIIVVVVTNCSFLHSQEQSKAEHLFIITIDGLRWEEVYGGAVDSLMQSNDFSSYQKEINADFGGENPKEKRQKLMPFFWSKIENSGQLYGNRWEGNKANVTNIFWFSYPGYSEILCGYSDPRINSNKKIPNPSKTVLEWLHEKEEFKGKVAAFGSWDVFPYIVNEERSGIPVNAGYRKAAGGDLSQRELFLNELTDQAPKLWNSVRTDFLTHHYALEYIKREHPRVVYISYGETDDFAHDGSYNRYLYAAHATDQMIKELWDYIQSDPVYKDKTAILITTDHGRGNSPMGEWKSHGKTFEGSNAIWIAALGAGIPAKGEVTEEGQLWQNQIARTGAWLLGYEYNGVGEEAGRLMVLDKQKQAPSK